MKKYYKQLIKKYDFNKLNTKAAELLEITNKFEHYMKKPEKLYLKPLYITAYFLTVIITMAESKHALKKTSK